VAVGEKVGAAVGVFVAVAAGRGVLVGVADGGGLDRVDVAVVWAPWASNLIEE
jgi:hypothetical protein